MNKMSSFILTGFCTLLFGGGMSSPAYVNPSLARLLLLVRDRSVADALGVDQYKLSLDLGRVSALNRGRAETRPLSARDGGVGGGEQASRAVLILEHFL